MSVTMNPALQKDLQIVITKIVSSGEESLDMVDMKKIKSICKKDNVYVDKAFQLLWTMLQRPHCEIRLSTVMIMDQLFHRSHHFRVQLLKEFQRFMELTLEINMERRLPPPKKAAVVLKAKTTEIVMSWNTKYGEGYATLRLACNFLQECKKVNFTDIAHRNEAERRAQEERQTKLQEMKNEKLRKIEEQIAELYDDLLQLCFQFENCLQLLMPKPDECWDHGEKTPQLSSQSSEQSEDATTQDQVDVKPVNSNMNIENTISDVDNKAEIKTEGTPEHTSRVDTEEDDLECVRSKTICDDVDMSIKSEPAEASNEGDTETSGSNVPSSSAEDTSQSDDHQVVKSEPPDLANTAVKEESSYTDETEVPNTTDCEQPYDESDYVYSSHTQDLRAHGVGEGCVINIDLNKTLNVVESKDNTDIVQNVKDLRRVIEGKAKKTVNGWLEDLSKCGGSEATLKKIIDLKESITNVQRRVDKINFTYLPKTQKIEAKDEDDGDSDSDDGFEEVAEKDGFEADIPEHLKNLMAEEASATTSSTTKKAPIITNHEWQPVVGEVNDPTTSAATINVLKRKISFLSSDGSEPSTSGPSAPSKASRLPVATHPDVPVVPFGTDLVHWGEDVETPMIARFDTNHRFWAAPENEVAVDKAAVESMTHRVINFTGEFKPVKWKCRAPLSNGKLCPRMDRIKCPFHGPVIPRDESGNPSRFEDVVNEMKARIMDDKKKHANDRHWETSEVRQMQSAIQQTTGVALKRTEKKGKGKKSSGLTNINKPVNSIRKRLEKKVFKRGTLNRVCAALERINTRRHSDKFANSFQSTHS